MLPFAPHAALNSCILIFYLSDILRDHCMNLLLVNIFKGIFTATILLLQVSAVYACPVSLQDVAWGSGGELMLVAGGPGDEAACLSLAVQECKDSINAQHEPFKQRCRLHCLAGNCVPKFSFFMAVPCNGSAGTFYPEYGNSYVSCSASGYDQLFCQCLD